MKRLPMRCHDKIGTPYHQIQCEHHRRGYGSDDSRGGPTNGLQLCNEERSVVVDFTHRDYFAGAGSVERSINFDKRLSKLPLKLIFQVV
jgi:hypothetical protein